MNEINENVVETTTDSFLDGFESDAIQVETDTIVNAEDVSKQVEETKAEETAETNENTENVTVEENVVVNKVDDVSKAEEPSMSWNLKVLGEEKTVNAKDITVDMLQKAYDYDRIRGKYDESKPVMELMKSFAEKSNMSVGEYIAFIRTEAKKSQGMSDEEAKRTIALEDREAAVSVKEAQNKEIEMQKNAEVAAKQAEEKRLADDLTEFSKVFPDVYKKAKDDPNTIPQVVWDAVRQERISLTSAYSRWAVTQAQEKLNAVETNKANASRSTGSMKSAGNDTKAVDDFLAEW